LLLKQGLRNVWIRGALPLAAGAPRVAGRAFTLRFVPAREDLATPASWSSPTSTRAAIEAMPEGCVAVVDTHGTTDAGFWGDILCARMVMRGVAGLVSDGVVRDLAGVLETGLPVWARGTAAPPWSRDSRSSAGSSDGAEVWQQEQLKSKSAASGPVVVIDVPADRFSDDDYTVTLRGMTSSGGVEELDGYVFRARGRR
jgi:hypothetical protein